MPTSRTSMACRPWALLGVAALLVLAIGTAEELLHIAEHGGLPGHQHAVSLAADGPADEAFGHSHSKSSGGGELLTQGQTTAVVLASALVVFAPDKARSLLRSTRQDTQPPPSRLSQSRDPPGQA
ncbi:MAG: hypothetical protein HYY25_01420 [Candidatus Wallbacteria bacterium]|nr:hypothetical protein [Candidatus Wallbacteria bacterium]